jgi:hypothetical protein
MMRVYRSVSLQDFVQLKAKRSIFVFVVRNFLQVVNVTINKLRIRLRLSGVNGSSPMAEEVTGYFLETLKVKLEKYLICYRFIG